MKINFTQPILDQNDEPVKEGPFVTLRSTCTSALFAQIQGDDGLDPFKRAELGCLGMEIMKNDEINVTAEDIAMIKARIGKIAPNLIVHRAFELLDPKAKPAALHAT